MEPVPGAGVAGQCTGDQARPTGRGGGGGHAGHSILVFLTLLLPPGPHLQGGWTPGRADGFLGLVPGKSLEPTSASHQPLSVRPEH